MASNRVHLPADRVDPLDVLAILEEGPYETGPLAHLFGVSSPVMYAALVKMTRAGSLARLPYPDRRWTLAGRRLETPTRARPVAAEDLPGAVAKKAKPKDHGVSWWAAHAAPEARAEFIGAARAHNEEMRTKLDKAWCSSGQVRLYAPTVSRGTHASPEVEEFS